MKLKLFLGFVASVAYAAEFSVEDYTGHVHGAGCNHGHAAESAEHQHEHGEGCTHDHAAEGEHQHEHGEGCTHDHAAEGEHQHEHGEGCTHDHAAEGEHQHEHGEGCTHDHAAEGEHQHEHSEDCTHDHAAEGEHQHEHSEACTHDHAAEGEHQHEHGEGCTHDHAAEGEHQHEHGEGCTHDHAAEGEHQHEHSEGCTHDHAAEGEHQHEHGEGCTHDHAAEGEHEHGEGCTHDHAAEGEHQHEHGEGCTHDHGHEHGDSCSGHDHGHEHGAGCSHDHSSGPVLVTADAHARHISAMKIEEVPAASHALTHSLYGHLFVPNHALETYSLPCGGRISLNVKSAQTVKKGDILYTLVSPEVNALVADIKKEEAAIARCGEEIASVSQRLTRLKAAGTSNSDLEEQLNFKNAEKRQLERELEVSKVKLNILVMGAEIKPENGLPTLVVRATKDGIVRNVGITQGSWGEQGAAVVTMSNLAAMEIEGTLYGNNVPDFSTVRATRLSGRDNKVLEGTWRMAEQVDEEKQTRAFYFTPAELPADARPGQLCRVDFYADGGEEGYVTIPDSALVKVGIDDVVFLEVKEGTFAMVKVKAGESRRGMTPVKGLIPGQRMVVKGGYELRYLLPADGSQQKKAGHFHADGKFHEGEDH
ncbi:MAG: hypothetical protein IJE88_06620 [Akkermansia sp.]|nr:hypothetical protein [Akkermansia sp.]